jgi:hypothetical protein
MKAVRFAVAAIVTLALAGCGVPDLVAHGVKAYERSQDSANQPAAAQAAPAPAYQSAPAYQPAPAYRQPEPEMQPAAMPARERITAEPLK